MFKSLSRNCQMLIYNYVLNDEPAVIIIISNFDHLSYLYRDYKDLSNINNVKRYTAKCLAHTRTHTHIPGCWAAQYVFVLSFFFLFVAFFFFFFFM